MPRVSTKFEVRGVEPANDARWRLVPESVRRAFWKGVVKLVKDEYEFERARGRDRYGRKLAPITRYTRAHRKSAMGSADANAPPLTPADAKSRTVAFFDGRAFADHAEFFWRAGWGRILHFHRVGARNRWSRTGRLPIRDVIGISTASERKIAKQATAQWEVLAKAHPVVEPPRPAPKPKGGIPPVVYLGTRAPQGQRRKGTILVYTGKVTGPPTIGESGLAVPPRGGGKPKLGSGGGRAAARAAIQPRALPKGAAGRGVDQPKFKPEDRAKNAGNRTVVVGTSLADAAWRRDGGYYIPPGGGSDQQKYQNALAYVRKALADGGSITQPRATFGNGVLSFLDGRHRFAALRDLGVSTVSISFDVASIPEVRKKLT